MLLYICIHIVYSRYLGLPAPDEVRARAGGGGRELQLERVRRVPEALQPVHRLRRSRLPRRGRGEVRLLLRVLALCGLPARGDARPSRGGEDRAAAGPARVGDLDPRYVPLTRVAGGQAR